MASKRFTSVLPSAARTANPTAVEVDTKFADDLLLIIDVSAVALTPQITVTISGVDPISGNTYTILDSAGISAVGTTTLQVGPASTPSANSVADAVLPLKVQVSVAHLDADSITYSIAAITEE